MKITHNKKAEVLFQKKEYHRGIEITESEINNELNWFIIRANINELIRMRYEILWKEIESIWTKDAKENGYQTLLNMFKNVVHIVIKKDYDSIINILNKTKIHHKLIIGCLQYFYQIEYIPGRVQIVEKEFNKLLENIFYVPEQLIFAFKEYNKTIIPEIFEILNNKKFTKMIDLPLTDTSPENKDKDSFIKIISDIKNELRKTKPKGYRVTQKDVYVSIPMAKSTFSERLNNYNIDFKGL